MYYLLHHIQFLSADSLWSCFIQPHLLMLLAWLQNAVDIWEKLMSNLVNGKDELRKITNFVC